MLARISLRFGSNCPSMNSPKTQGWLIIFCSSRSWTSGRTFSRPWRKSIHTLVSTRIKKLSHFSSGRCFGGFDAPKKTGESPRSLLANQCLKPQMKQLGLFLHTGCLDRLSVEVLLDIECRSHADQYGLFICIRQALLRDGQRECSNNKVTVTLSP